MSAVLCWTLTSSSWKEAPSALLSMRIYHREIHDAEIDGSMHTTEEELRNWPLRPCIANGVRSAHRGDRSPLDLLLY